MTRDEKLEYLLASAICSTRAECGLERRLAAILLHHYSYIDGYTHGVEWIWRQSGQWRAPALRRSTLRLVAAIWHELDVVEAKAKGGAA